MKTGSEGKRSPPSLDSSCFDRLEGTDTCFSSISFLFLRFISELEFILDEEGIGGSGGKAAYELISSDR